MQLGSSRCSNGRAVDVHSQTIGVPSSCELTSRSSSRCRSAICAVGETGLTLRRVRPAHVHVRRRLADLQPRTLVIEDRRLEEEHAIVARQPRHQMLRALEDDIPAQVREHEQRLHEGTRAWNHAWMARSILLRCERPLL